MSVDRFSHPGPRKNPDRHGTIERFLKGCRCWRCTTAMQKDVKQKQNLVDRVMKRIFG